MGIYDRDYIRESEQGSILLSGPGSTSRRIVIGTVVCFVLQLFLESPDFSFTAFLSVDRGLLSGQIWKLVTYAFAHSPGSPFHILWNMYFLWILGPDLEHIYGAREFLRFYLGAAVFAALCYVGLSLAVTWDHPQMFLRYSMLGASGSLSAVLVVMAMYYPTRQMIFMFIIPIEIRWLVFLQLIFDLYPVLANLGGANIYTGVANGAHLGGMLYGFLYKHYDLRWSRLFAGWSWSRVRRAASPSRNNVKLYRPPEEPVSVDDSPNLEDQVDVILEKISREGEASLTDAERETLKEASRRYKDRR